MNEAPNNNDSDLSSSGITLNTSALDEPEKPETGLGRNKEKTHGRIARERGNKTSRRSRPFAACR